MKAVFDQKRVSKALATPKQFDIKRNFVLHVLTNIFVNGAPRSRAAIVL